MRLIKKAREPPPALSCFAHSCNLAKSHYTGQAIDPFRLHTSLSTMNAFNFQAIQSLELTSEDKPHLDVKDGHIVLTAERGEDRIIITAPLSGVLPKVAKTTVKTPVRSMTFKQRSHHRGTDNPVSKLDDNKVREIRAMAADKKLAAEYGGKMSFYTEIGKIYGVNKYTIKNVVEGISWKHVK